MKKSLPAGGREGFLLFDYWITRVRRISLLE